MCLMHAFEVLGDPIRRRILELLADGELTSGVVAAVGGKRERRLRAGTASSPKEAIR